MLVLAQIGCETSSQKMKLPPLPSPSRLTRSECMGIAESYRAHRWKPTEANVKHGPDTKGIQVDSPDIGYNPSGAVPGWWKAGEECEGIPYQWGGFCTLKEFDAGISEGKAGGDVYTTEKRRLLDDAVSDEAVGIDCSGFISKCWKLPRSYSTRELHLVSHEISYDDLQPGDILNTPNAHCVLFSGWNDGTRIRMNVYETGCPPTWKVVSHPLETAWMKVLGFKCLRYNGIREGL